VKNYFGYIRVSTARQGEKGVSLQEQRDAIVRYAERNGLTVAEWFEERETAAKRGRPVFMRMMQLLRNRMADGVIIHKIDRSARNMKDWAEIGELSDSGLEVRFVIESVDMRSRGGRLSADIMAVVAADYVRNLKEEIRKGFYGRIKQGILPLPAPLGYLDCGAGKPKEIDPVKGPFVRRAFELYATGRYNLDGLLLELRRMGLRNRRGGRVTMNGLSNFLNNPFYIGLIRLKRTGEMFPGAHERLIPKSLFDRVQRILRGKTNTRIVVHDFLFRRLLSCHGCRFSLIGERQKGHVYYRCHTRECPTATVREEAVEEAMEQVFRTLEFTEKEKEYLAQRIGHLGEESKRKEETQGNALTLLLAQIHDRLTKLTDAYLDGVLEKELLIQRKTALLMEKRDLEERIAQVRVGTQALSHRLAEYLELAGSVYQSYKTALPEEKRDLVRIVTSNRTVLARNVDIMLAEPFRRMADRTKTSNCGAYRDTPRTLDQLLQGLWRWAEANPTARVPAPSAVSSDVTELEKPRKRWRSAA